MTEPTIEQILSELDAPHREKIAAATTEAPAAAPVAEVTSLGTHKEALDAAMAQLTDSTKTAEAAPLEGASATVHLEKMAAQIESAEAYALEKEAAFFARAFMSNLLTEADRYASAAQAKTAAAAPVLQPTAPLAPPETTIEDAVKTAAATGAADTRLVLELAQQQKQAAATSPQPAPTFAEGADATLDKLAEFCHASFNRGFTDVEAVVNQ